MSDPLPPLDFRAEVRDHADVLVDGWLREDVYDPDGPVRSRIGGMELIQSEALTELGCRVLDFLADEQEDGLRAWLQSDSLAGYADKVVLHAVQCLIGRVREHIRELLEAQTGMTPSEAATTMATLWESTDLLYRDVLDHQMRLSRDAMPEDGSDFQDLASVVKDTLYSTLASGMIRYVSPGIEQLTGHLASEFLHDQHLWSRLVLPEDIAMYHALYEGVIGTHEPMEAVYRFRHGTTERIRHVLDRATPVLREGKVVRVDGILIDVTDRIELETRLERAEQLRCLGQLARDVAHDFNNLLVSILGHTDQLLAQTDPATETAEALGRISAAADKGSKLTDRLLAFARGSASSRTKAETELHRVAREAMELARPSVPNGLQIDFVTSSVLPLVEGDSVGLGEALLNLILNAIHACDEGGGTRVTVRVRPGTPDECERIASRTACVVEVIDDGPGMTPKVLDRVFEPLFTTRADRGGTGLGCALSFGVAVEHQGILEVDSRLHHGTTFRLLIPGIRDRFTEVEDTATFQWTSVLQESHVEEPAELPPPVPSSISLGPHILAVDDEPSVRQLIEDLLEGAGFCVTTVPSGEAAISLVRAEPDAFDVIILDVMMHPVDGTEAYCRIREILPDVPIVFCTGHSDAHRIKVPEVLTRAPVVKKPFRAAHLIQAVRSALME